MPLGKSPAERYALKLRSACDKITKGEPLLSGRGAGIGPVDRAMEDDGYEFYITATRNSGRLHGPSALIHVSDDGDVTIETSDDGYGYEFPKPLLDCIVHRAEILR